MKSFEEIEREQATYVRAANEALASMRDKGGMWWEYIISHRTFELVVGDPYGIDNLVLCLAACESIAGPVNWPEQNLEVVWRSTGSLTWEFTLQDEAVGFEAVGRVFVWRKNYDIWKGNLHLG